MNNIAIIGGHGFIGKNFSNFFIDKGFAVTLIGRNPTNSTFSSAATSIIADIQNTSELLKAVQNSDTVIWLASSLVPGSHGASLEIDFNTNIKPVISFLEKASTDSLKKFIYLSSGGTIYGDTSNPVNFQENDPKSPISEYGLSKLITENYIEFITRTSGFESYILRPSNVYGKYQNLSKPQGIIGFAFRSLITNSTIDLYDEGKVVRDFVSVNDVANAVWKCIGQPSQPSVTHTYNVGSEKPVSIKVIIDKIGETAGTAVKTISKSSRNFDCHYNVLSIQKIKKDLNWEPSINLEEGLKEIWEWIKEEGNG